MQLREESRIGQMWPWRYSVILVILLFIRESQYGMKILRGVKEVQAELKCFSKQLR